MESLDKLVNTPEMQYDLLPFIRCTYPALPVYRLLLITVSVAFWKSYQMFVVNCVRIADKRTSFRLVSFTHAIVASTQAFYIFSNYHNLFIYSNPIPNYCEPIPYAEYTFCVSIGYFIYDLYKNITTEFSWDFVGHGTLSLLIYLIIIVSGVGTRPALTVLLYEVSTIFLHFYAFMFYLGYTKLGAIFRIVFALLFFIFRVVLGSFVTFEMLDTILLRWRPIKVDCLPFFWQMVCLVINIMFHCLNLYWLSYLIIKRVIQHAKEGKTVLHVNEGQEEEFDKYRNEQWKKHQEKQKKNKKIRSNKQQ